MEKKLSCTVCGVDSPHEGSNFCYCCGASRHKMDFLPVVPIEFRASKEEADIALEKTLARFKSV